MNETTFAEQVAAAMKELRRQSGLSQKSIAELLDVSAITISRWENGTREPRLNDIYRYALVIGVPVLDIFDNDEFTHSEAPLWERQLLARL